MSLDLFMKSNPFKTKEMEVLDYSMSLSDVSISSWVTIAADYIALWLLVLKCATNWFNLE